ncbi:hypothetical protein GH714_040503 [Hevea brasiliensis]|uniref:Auxin-responsive protein n=1 Tax=Hevea brasiliensis TaxID=3981 RepID=A0A6A6MKB7_HEVBR|nr:hypothetical protein GH714_040503 [Hevea brasiliensis]
MTSGRQEPTYTDLLSGFGTRADSSHGFGVPFVDQTAAAASRELALDQEGKINSLASPWSLMSSGLSLSNPVTLEPAASHRNTVNEPISTHPQSQQLRVMECDQRSEQSKGSKLADDNEHEKQVQAGALHTRDNQGKVQNVSTRSCTKVHKQGIALGRSVDLTKFNNYDELIAELDRLFEFDGELMAPKKNWLIVYTDDEGDMMLVGDDPWQEFVGMVRKIFIYTREEVQKMNPGTLNSKGDENLLDVEGVDAKEVKCLPLPPAHGFQQKASGARVFMPISIGKIGMGAILPLLRWQSLLVISEIDGKNVIPNFGPLNGVIYGEDVWFKLCPLYEPLRDWLNVRYFPG